MQPSFATYSWFTRAFDAVDAMAAINVTDTKDYLCCSLGLYYLDLSFKMVALNDILNGQHGD